jgi:hypothetical protein
MSFLTDAYEAICIPNDSLMGRLDIFTAKQANTELHLNAAPLACREITSILV